MTRVVIVGAGVIGLYCALKLAKAGAQVIVLEGEREDFSVYGPTTSLAAAGMLMPIADEPTDPDMQTMALQSFDMWRRETKGATWEDGVRFDGGIVISPEPDALVSRIKACGREASVLSGAQWRKRTGFEAAIDNAVLFEPEGIADPIRVLSGLAMEARLHGVQTLFANDVGEVTGNSVQSFDTDVPFEADVVLLAPGVWSTEALVRAAPVLRHVRGCKGQLVPVSVKRPIDASIRAPEFYLARRMEDDVVLGSTLEFDVYDRNPSEAKAAELLAAADKLLPGEVKQRERGWAGIRPMSPDGWPMIGRSGDVWVAAGHSRNGWLLAPLTADIIATQIMGGGDVDPLWKRFAPDRFET